MFKTHALLYLKALCILMLVVPQAMNSSAQSEKILHSFVAGQVGDGYFPQAGLILDSKGNLYGTTYYGGTASNYCSNCGTVFELSPGANATWTEQVIYSFGVSSSDGENPVGGVTLDRKGNLYGTTQAGGTEFSGTVYQLIPGQSGTWTENVLYNFKGSSDGCFPSGGLVLDSGGNIYGMAEECGALGYGVVFELVPGQGGTWTEKVLHSFTGGNDGELPYAITLTLDGQGNLYGVSRLAGSHDYGVVFELMHGTWTEKILYAFTGGGTGIAPIGGLAIDSVGNLYGVTQYLAFELSPSPKGAWTETVLHNFTGGSDGAYPSAQLVFDKAGSLYGTTFTGGHHLGTVFKLKPGVNGVWTEKVLYAFQPNGGDGASPEYGTLAIDATGNLYGTTQNGGASNFGTVFELTQ